VLKPRVPDGLNLPIYSVMAYAVLEEEAEVNVTGIARGGLRPP
jgi:hypothetical protein